MNIDKLHNIVSNSIVDVEFYNEYRNYYELPEDFNNLPIIDKLQIINSSKSILSHISPEKTISEWTSGTTGTPIQIFWNNKEYIESYWYLWQYRKKWYGILPFHRVCTFHTITSRNDQLHSQNVLISPDKRKMSLGRYVFDEETLKSYMEAICWFDPDWILGPPSVIHIITTYLERKKRKLNNLKYIELNGEYVSNGIINYIKNYYQVQVSNLYGAIEFNGIALVCPHGKMHIIDRNVYVEIVQMDNISNIVLTSLVNSYMPLIRYNIGDIGYIQHNKCNCGKEKELVVKCGRTQEFIRLNDVKIDPAIFSLLINEINREYTIVQQFQIVVDYKTIKMIVLSDSKYNTYLNNTKKNLEHKLAALINNCMKIEICIINSCNLFYIGEKKFNNVVFI